MMPVFRISSPWMAMLLTRHSPTMALKSGTLPQPSMTGFSPGALVMRMVSLGQRLLIWTGPYVPPWTRMVSLPRAQDAAREIVRKV